MNSSLDFQDPNATQIRDYASAQPPDSWKSAKVFQPEGGEASKACGIQSREGEKDESSDYAWAWRLWEIELKERVNGAFSLVVKAGE